MKLLYVFLAIALLILAVVSNFVGDLDNSGYCSIMAMLILIYVQILERR